MRNNVGNFTGVSFILGCLVMQLGCASLDSRKSVKPLTEMTLTEPVVIELRPVIPNTEVTQYYSNSRIQTYVDGEIMREKEEAVEFSVQSKVIKVASDKKSFDQMVELLHKDGPVNLRTLGFPEEDEKLNMRLTVQAEVLKAGTYPKTSIFFIPPLSLPTNPVQPGETWSLHKEWISSGNGIPLSLDLVSTLRGWVKCGADRCANIEVSGEVTMKGIDPKALQFKSEIAGRLLFSIDRGVLVWSLLKNKEKLTTPKSMMTVFGCMESRLEQPFIWKSSPSKNIKCEANFWLPDLP